MGSGRFSDVAFSATLIIYTSLEDRSLLKMCSSKDWYTGPVFTDYYSARILNPPTLSPYFPSCLPDILNGIGVRSLCLERPCRCLCCCHLIVSIFLDDDRIVMNKGKSTVIVVAYYNYESRITELYFSNRYLCTI